MTDANPYATPATVNSDPTAGKTPSTKRLWIAYGIAPVVAPLVAALTVFLVGIVYLANHPDDTGTPIGVIMLPIMLLVIGVPAAYGVAGLIGMPIAFALRKRDKLNGYTVHGSALLCAVAIALGIAIVALLLPVDVSDTESGEVPYFARVLGGAFGIFLVLAPLILASTATFWLIGVRSWKRTSASDAASPID